MSSVIVIGTVIASLFAPPASVSASAESSPPPDRITLEVVTVNGSGCPAGTAAVAPSPDNSAFTVTYSNYLAQVGVGATPIDFRKNCQLNVRVNIPQGFTYAIASADYRGYASLASGATALERASYYFQGQSATSVSSHSFAGPLDDNWQATDVTDVAALVWAPCGEVRNVNINTELRVGAGTSNTASSTSLMTMDSTDASVSTIYHLSWRTC